MTTLAPAEPRQLPIQARQPRGTARRREQPPRSSAEREPPTFVLGLVAAAIALLPLLKPSLGGNLGPVDLVIGAAMGAVVLWASTTALRLRAPYALGVLLFMVAGALGALTNPYAGRTAAALALTQDAWLLLWALAVANIARTPRALAVLLRTWAVAATVWAGVLIMGVIANQRLLAGFSPRSGRRASLTLGDPNLAANYFVTSLLVVVAARYPAGRLRRFLASALMLTAVVLTGSNGGLATAVLALAVVAIHGSWRRWGALVTVAALALGGVALASEVVSCSAAGRTAGLGAACQVHPTHLARAARNSDNQVIRESIGRGDQSTSDRRLLLGETFALYRSGGALLGQGPTAVKQALARRQSAYVKEAHNDLVAALIERGVLGGAALVVLIAGIGLRTMSCSPSTLRRGPAAPVVPRPEALIAAVLAMAVAAWFYEVLHQRHLWALVGIIAAIHHWGGEVER